MEKRKVRDFDLFEKENVDFSIVFSIPVYEWVCDDAMRQGHSMRQGVNHFEYENIRHFIFTSCGC